MGRSVAIWLLVAASLILLLADATHPLPRHAPGGGGAGQWGRPEGLRRGGTVLGVGAARRLGQRTPVRLPPTPEPNPGKGMGMRRLSPPPSIRNSGH
ncbi:hypothetical protein ZWY2020_023260 [Hordeum vulgare]|nr:hypothetical protein ZWY2020_023260 [Hordeum vulgare]